jgi:hypothetical protein
MLCLNYNYKIEMGTWRNWYTRTVQNRMEQSLEVRVLSCPLIRENVQIVFGQSVVILL